MSRTATDMTRILDELAALKDSVAALAGDGATAARKAVRDAASGASAMAAEKGEEAVGALRGTIRDRPITSLAAAFAFGLSAARLMFRH